jgi:hypothetical protein
MRGERRPVASCLRLFTCCLRRPHPDPVVSCRQSIPLLSIGSVDVCNVHGRGSLSHYLVYSESPPRWCSLAIVLPIYIHPNQLLVSNRSIQNTYRLVTLAVLTLLSLSCSLERFAFVYHVIQSKTRLPLHSIHDVTNHQYGHTWINYTHQIATKRFPKTNQQLRAQCSPNRQKHASTPRSHVVTCKIRRFETRDTSPITYHR